MFTCCCVHIISSCIDPCIRVWLVASSLRTPAYRVCVYPVAPPWMPIAGWDRYIGLAARDVASRRGVARCWVCACSLASSCQASVQQHGQTHRHTGFRTPLTATQRIRCTYTKGQDSFTTQSQPNLSPCEEQFHLATGTTDHTQTVTLGIVLDAFRF